MATVNEAALQAVLDQWRTDVTAYGATLSVRVPGHDDIHLASGIDDRNPDTPMPTDGTFAGASITKTFVAAVALQLVDEGRLALDDTVEAWLPELPAANQTTLAMLLDHTAGLSEWSPDILADLTRKYTGDEVLVGDVTQPPSGRPGERFFYSNANFTAAAVLIGESWAKGYRDHRRANHRATLAERHPHRRRFRQAHPSWLVQSRRRPRPPDRQSRLPPRGCSHLVLGCEQISSRPRTTC